METNEIQLDIVMERLDFFSSQECQLYVGDNFLVMLTRVDFTLA